MREIVSFGIGQSGIGCIESFLELLCHEHGINPQSGKLEMGALDSNLDSFFAEKPSGRYSCRSILVDSDPISIEYFNYSSFVKGVFLPENTVKGDEDCSSSFAKGLRIGKELIPSVLDRLRLTIEECDSVEGSVVFHSMAGGTGSAFTSLLIDSIQDDYGWKFNQLCSTVCPYLYSAAPMERVNCSLFLDAEYHKSNFNVCHENKAIVKLLQTQGVSSPSFRDINRVIGGQIAALFSGVRFPADSSPSMTMSEIKTNLIPFPLLKTLFSGVAHLDENSTDKLEKNKPGGLLLESLKWSSLLFPRGERFSRNFKVMGILPIFRGAWSQSDVQKACQFLKESKEIGFVKWVPNSIKHCLSSRKTVQIREVAGQNGKSSFEESKGEFSEKGNQETGSSFVKEINKSIVTIINDGSMMTSLIQWIEGVERIYPKGFYLHWFVSDGMEYDSVRKSRETLASRSKDYFDAIRQVSESNSSISNAEELSDENAE